MEQIPGCYLSCGTDTASPSWILLLPSLAPRYHFRHIGQDLLDHWPCSRSREVVVQGCLGNRLRSWSRLLQLSSPGGKGDGELASCDRLLSPERVCSANSVQDGDRSLHAPVHQRGGFLNFHRSEGRVSPDTRSSVVEEATEVPVGGDSLSAQEYRVTCWLR